MKFKSKTILLVAWLLSFVLVLGNLVSVFAEGGGEKNKAEEKSVIFTVDNSDLVKSDSAITGRSELLLNELELNKNPHTNVSLNLDFASNVGDIALVVKTPEGKFKTLLCTKTQEEHLGDDGGSFVTSEEKTYSWSSDFDSFDSVLASTLSFDDDYVCSINKYFPNEVTEIVDYLKGSEVYIIDTNLDTKLTCSFYDFVLMNGVSRTINPLDFKVFALSDKQLKLQVLEKGALCTEVTDENLTSYALYQGETLLYTSDSTGLYNEVIVDIPYDETITLEVVTYGRDYFTFKLSDLLDKSDDDSSVIENTIVQPSIVITGIPTSTVNDAFSVNISTDIPCKILDGSNQVTLGETDGKNSVSFTIDKGNGTYSVICQPTLKDTDEFKYLEKVESFEITCFSADYKVPDDTEDDIITDDTVENDDLPLPDSDNNVPNIDDGKLEQTGISSGTRLWLSIGVFSLLGIIFLALYKKDIFKKFLSLFLVLALVLTGIQLPNFVSEVKASNNVTTGGNISGGDVGDGVAGVGEFCYARYVITYTFYPVEGLRDANDRFSIYDSAGWADYNIRGKLNSESRGGFVLVHDDMASKVYWLLRNNGTDASNPKVQAGQRSSLGHSTLESRLQTIKNKYDITFPDITEKSFQYSDKDKNRVFTSEEVQGCIQALEDGYGNNLEKKAFILNTLFNTNTYTKSNCGNTSIAVEIGLGIHQASYSQYYIQNTIGMDSYLGKTEHRGSSHQSHADIMCTQLKSFFKNGELCSSGTNYPLGERCIMSTWAYDWSSGTGLRQVSDYFYNTKFNAKATNVGSLSENNPERTRKSGAIFIFTEDDDEPVVRYEYNYALIAVNEPGATDTFTTTNKAIKYDSNLLRRTKKYEDDVLVSTTYALSTNGSSYSAEYTDLDKLFSEKVATKYKEVTSGYTIAKANIGYINPYHLTDEAIIGIEDSVNVNYKYNGNSVTGSTFNAGKTYTFYQDKTYTYAASLKSGSNNYGNIASFTSNISTIQKYALQVSNLASSSNISANVSWSRGANYSILSTKELPSVDFLLPVISFSQYKAPTVKSTVYEVELTYDGSNYIPTTPKKLKDLSYSVGNSGSYTIGSANTKYVVISSGIANPSNTGSSSLAGFANMYGTAASYGSAKKGDTIKVGATTAGSGYNIYVFTLKGIDTLSLNSTYTLEPYMLNRLYAGLGSNGTVYTLTGADFNYYTGSSVVNKADLYQIAGTNGLTFNAGLLSGNIKNCGSGTNNGLNTAITYSTGDNHKIFAGYNTGTSYKKISILDSYSLALSRGIRGDKKVLSSIAVGTDKSSVDNIDATNRSKFNLGYGLKGNTPNSAYASATHRNYTFGVDKNVLKVEGRYPYNNKSGNTYQAILPTQTNYNNVKYNRTVQGGVENKANYLLGWSGSTGNRYRTLNFTANVVIESYNSGALSETKANVNSELLSIANKTIYAKDNNTHLKFYPELYMMYYTSPTTANYKVPVMGEYERKVQGSSLYGFKVTASGNPTGKTVSDMTSTSGTTYRGSDVTLVVDGVGAKFEAFGYSLDILNQSTDSFNNSIVGNNNVYTAWGNSGTADILKNEFNAWLGDELKDIEVDIKLDLANGKSYSGFDISTGGVSMNSASTVNDKTWSITVKNGKLVEDANYTNLIKQIASDFGITEAEAKNYFAKSNIAKSIIDSMETCVNSKNTSEKLDAITGGNHWYDEFTRTFVIRRFSNNTIKAGSITVQDKIDMNANTSTTTGSGINQTIKGNDVNADWKITVKRDEGTILNNVKVTGASFDVSYLTTED